MARKLSGCPAIGAAKLGDTLGCGTAKAIGEARLGYTASCDVANVSWNALDSSDVFAPDSSLAVAVSHVPLEVVAGKVTVVVEL